MAKQNTNGNAYLFIKGYEGIYKANGRGVIKDTRSNKKSELYPGETIELTDNKGVTNAFTFEQIMRMRVTGERYYKPTKNVVSAVADGYIRQIRERDNRIRELEFELARLRRYISE